MNIQILKVAGNSNPKAVSDKINQKVINDGVLHIDCIGAKATYTVVKALILSTDYLVKEGYKFNLRPYYVEAEVINNEKIVKKTAIRWTMIAKKE